MNQRSDSRAAAPGEETEVLLAVNELRTYFDTPRGVVRAVDGVTFSVLPGRTVGLVGESGSGKTVLCRSVMNLLPKRTAIPAGGQVLYKGVDLRTQSAAAMREIWGREMAMVFQDPMTALNPVVKIGRQLTESLTQHFEIKRTAARETAVAALRSVGLSEPERRLDQYPHELSGGMCQRVTIAIALACGPSFLVADEPTTALDVTVQAQILDLLQQQHEERGMAMLLVTHDLGVVAGRTDEIIVMYAGQIVEQASTRELFEQTRHPYTEALLNSIPRIENRSHTRLRVIPGRPPDLINVSKGCRFAPRCRYAQPRCLEDNPELVPGQEVGHQYRCFFPVGTPEGDDALARNYRAGRTSAGMDLMFALGEPGPDGQLPRSGQSRQWPERQASTGLGRASGGDCGR